MIGGRLRQRLRGGDSSNRHASPGRRRGSVQTNQGVPRQQSSGSASALESSQHSATEVSLVCTVVDEDGDVNVFTAEGHRLVLRVTTAATAAGTEPQMCYDNIAALQYHPSDAAAGELCVYFSGDNEVYYSLSMPAGGLRLQLARLQRLAAHCGVEFADLSAVADAGEDDALNGGGSPQDTAPTLDLVPPVTARAGSLTPPASLTPDAEQQPVLPVTSSLSVTSRRQSVHPSHAALLAAAGWLRGCGVDARVDEAAVFLAAEGFCTDEDMALLTEGDLLASGLRRCDVRRVLAALASRAAVPAAGPLVDDSAFDRKGPRVVQVGFTINQVSSIDTVGAAFTVAYKVFYVWLEPDLLGRKAEEVNWDEIWTPRGYIKNALDAGDVERRVRAYDIATGGTVRGRIMDPWVIETVRYRSTMSQPMALEDFPVDRQELTICVTTRNHGKKVEFRPAVVENILESQALAGWAFPTFRTHFDMSQPDNTGKRYPEFHITVEAQRIVRFYLVNICAQLSLLSTTTFFTVAIGPSEFSDRTQLTVTMLLTAITFKMSVSEWMPRIGYLTILDKYLIGTVLMIVLLMLENFLASLAAAAFSDSEVAIRWLDICAHAALLGLWAGCHIVAYHRIIFRRDALSYVEGHSEEVRKSGVALKSSRAVAAFLIAGRHTIDITDPDAGTLLERCIARIQAVERGRQVRRKMMMLRVRACKDRGGDTDN